LYPEFEYFEDVYDLLLSEDILNEEGKFTKTDSLSYLEYGGVDRSIPSMEGWGAAESRIYSWLSIAIYIDSSHIFLHKPQRQVIIL